MNKLSEIKRLTKPSEIRSAVEIEAECTRNFRELDEWYSRWSGRL